MTCPLWNRLTYTSNKGIDCDCVTGQHENIFDLKSRYNPKYKNKSRRWLPIVIMVVALAFWAWILKGV